MIHLVRKSLLPTSISVRSWRPEMTILYYILIGHEKMTSSFVSRRVGSWKLRSVLGTKLFVATVGAIGKRITDPIYRNTIAVGGTGNFSKPTRGSRTQSTSQDRNAPGHVDSHGLGRGEDIRQEAECEWNGDHWSLHCNLQTKKILNDKILSQITVITSLPWSRKNLKTREKLDKIHEKTFILCKILIMVRSS